MSGHAPSRFRGLGVLLSSRRRAVWAFFWTGLVGSLLFALLSRSGYLPREGKTGAVLILISVAGLLPPFALFGELTFRVTPGGRSFREAFLAGPTGALALPAAIQLGSLAACVATCLGALPGFLLSGVDPDPGLFVLLASNLLVFWGLFSAIVSLGNHTANAVLLLLFAPVVWLIAPIGGGYGREDLVPLTIWFCLLLGVLGGLVLALPYACYARPRHHWSDEVGVTQVSARDLGIWLLAGSLTLIPFVSLIWTFPLVVLSGLLIRRAPQAPGSRVPLGHFHFGARVCLSALLPVLLIGLAGDAYHFSASGRFDPERHDRGFDAPQGGRRVVLLSQHTARPSRERPPRRLEVSEGLGRVAVLGPRGEVLTVLPQRFGVLERDAWSADGRYVAVHDQDLGIFQGALPERVERVLLPTQGLADRLERIWAQSFQATYVFDTETGELQRLPLLELRPGWTRPEQLVRHTLGLGGQHVLRDGAGHEAETHERVRVLRYTPAGAVLSSKDGSELLFGEGGLRRP